MHDVSHSRRRVFAVAAWATLGFNVLVILGGTIVRATGSGDGCGASWPKCGDQFIPPNATVETMIEYSHRVTSVLAGLGIAAVFLLALWAFPKGHIVRKAASVSLVLLVLEALLGAGLVVFGWVDADISIGRMIVVPLHLTNTFMLLGALTLTAWWGSGHSPPSTRGRSGDLGWILAGAGIIVILGMTGALNALADTIFPSESVTGDLADKFGPTAPMLSRLRIVHPVVGVVGGMLIAWIANGRARFGSDRDRLYATAVTIIILSQTFVGIANIYFLTPIGLQVAHLMVADVLWIVYVVFGASILGARSEADAAAVTV